MQFLAAGQDVMRISLRHLRTGYIFFNGLL